MTEAKVAVYEGQHETRPAHAPYLTAPADEFARDNPEIADDINDLIVASDHGYLEPTDCVLVGGGAAPVLTVFVELNYDPNHEGVEQ